MLAPSRRHAARSGSGRGASSRGRRRRQSTAPLPNPKPGAAASDQARAPSRNKFWRTHKFSGMAAGAETRVFWCLIHDEIFAMSQFFRFRGLAGGDLGNDQFEKIFAAILASARGSHRSGVKIHGGRGVLIAGDLDQWSQPGLPITPPRPGDKQHHLRAAGLLQSQRFRRHHGFDFQRRANGAVCHRARQRDRQPRWLH